MLTKDKYSAFLKRELLKRIIFLILFIVFVFLMAEINLIFGVIGLVALIFWPYKEKTVMYEGEKKVIRGLSDEEIKKLINESIHSLIKQFPGINNKKIQKCMNKLYSGVLRVEDEDIEKAIKSGTIDQ